MRRSHLAFIIIVMILLLDQSSKIWIKTHMYLGQEYHIADWFVIHFTENAGMAFGMKFGGETGKLLLSLFRIGAVILIGFYIGNLVKQKAHKGFIAAMSLIFAGAMGNIIDSVFYGELFSSSSAQVAQFVGPGNGYGSWLHGHVVDMLYFPLVEGIMPDWVPFWGGDYFIFFRPVFNLADSAITVGVAMIILFQKRFFK